MNTFLNIPESKNDWENVRINIDHIVSYHYSENITNMGTTITDNASFIKFELINGENYILHMLNLDPKKIIKKIDKLMKIVKLDIAKTDTR